MLFGFKSYVILGKIGFVVTRFFTRGHLVVVLFLLIYSLNNSGLVVFFPYVEEFLCLSPFALSPLRLHFAAIVTFLSRGN